ncbi:MAG: efflux RND transporter periplasmic adaptor subunit [Deferribacteraceae bacterium]|jgi:membrane fusion protein (multidrug efflux system)|nr:efflux RND transporter periplasmic adaptor subunit [Deferribacteraceae bacterium]
MFKRVIVLAAIMSAAFIAAGCGKGGNEQRQTPSPTVIVVEAQTDNVISSSSFVGSVEAAIKASIGARVNGFLEKRMVMEGDLVNKDQVLFTIEKSQYSSAVRQAQATLAQANANMKNAMLQKERGEALLQSAGISQANYDNLNAAFLVAQANVSAAYAALENAKLNLSYTDVTSPIEGKVGFINFQIGETVGPSSGIITTVIAQEPMYVVFAVTDRQLQVLRKNYSDNTETDTMTLLADHAEIRITLSDGSLYPHSGKINFMNNAVTGTTDSVRLRGEFPNPEALLKQGQTVSVFVQSKTPEIQIVIPQAALQNDISGKYVLVVSDGGGVERRLVKVGAQINEKQVILENLNVGERVIVDGVQKVRPNVPVNALTQEQYSQMLQQQAQQAQQAGQGGGK